MVDPWNPFNKEENTLDLDLLKSEVGRFFPFYDMKDNYKTAAFYVNIDDNILEENFDKLRRSLSKKGYIPMLRYEKGEHLIYVVKKPNRKRKPVWVNYVLMVSVIITTVITGSILHIGESDIWNKELTGLMSNVGEIFLPENLFFGALLFSLPLLSILFIHEMGHYYISKKHGIETSLPFFLPVPPILPQFNIGTFGALISSHEPMPDKKALFDVGIAGPLAGFIVAVPVTIIGIATSEVVKVSELAAGETFLGTSILFSLIAQSVLNVSGDYAISFSPIAFAGWVGLLITAINLLPAGQLDGGHIFRAFLGKYQKYAGIAAIFIMILTGWFFFAIIIIFMIGVVHPPPLNDDSELDLKRKLLFFVAVAILILCFIPFPFGTV